MEALGITYIPTHTHTQPCLKEFSLKNKSNVCTDIIIINPKCPQKENEGVGWKKCLIGEKHAVLMEESVH